LTEPSQGHSAPTVKTRSFPHSTRPMRLPVPTPGSLLSPCSSTRPLCPSPTPAPALLVALVYFQNVLHWPSFLSTPLPYPNVASLYCCLSPGVWHAYTSPQGWFCLLSALGDSTRQASGAGWIGVSYLRHSSKAHSSDAGTNNRWQVHAFTVCV
jgi:hypothetical protein